MSEPQHHISPGREYPGLLSDEQVRRIEALTFAREVARNTSAGTIFSKGATEKITQTALLSLAHFVITGRRDYILNDGEYLDRQPGDDHDSSQ